LAFLTVIGEFTAVSAYEARDRIIVGGSFERLIVPIAGTFGWRKPMRGKDITINQRVTTGFAAVVVLLALIGGISFRDLGHIVGDSQQVIQGHRLDGALAQWEVDHLNWINQVNALWTDEDAGTLTVATGEHKCGLDQWLGGQGRKEAETAIPSLKPLLIRLEAAHKQLHDSVLAIRAAFTPVDETLPAILAAKEAAHLRWCAKMDALFIDNRRGLDIATDDHQCDLGRWLHGEGGRRAASASPEMARLIEAIIAPHLRLHQSAKEIQSIYRQAADDEASQAKARSEALKIYRTRIRPASSEVSDLLHAMVAEGQRLVQGVNRAKKIYATETLPALKATREILHALRKAVKANMINDAATLSAADTTRRNLSLLILFSIVLAMGISRFIAKDITGRLGSMCRQMTERVEQVTGVAGQVAAASQSLAEGASQQAAGIEEISSSLEEMSAMTTGNSNNAEQADGLMKNAARIVAKANEEMRELAEAMGQISRSSENTSKIIKTIDEIAFQTNLLALNAAVEAARAGESGAGFAVVAGEVRNLAMRAAEAARNTASLIEETITRVQEGASRVEHTEAAFNELASASDAVGKLISEIAVASQEQAQGIGQVNTAVSEMDRVVQQNAAHAEESAAAASELSAQAVKMKASVAGMTRLVGGKTGRVDFSIPTRRRSAADTSPAKALPAVPVDPAKLPNASSIPTRPSSPGELDPRQVIPMDDDDFSDF
jgi:methyl-accepting chemotaxis protein